MWVEVGQSAIRARAEIPWWWKIKGTGNVRAGADPRAGIPAFVIGSDILVLLLFQTIAVRVLNQLLRIMAHKTSAGTLTYLVEGSK